MQPEPMEPCTWCGTEVEPGDGFRAYLLSAATSTPAGSTDERRAVFCRLEHLVPWSIQGKARVLEAKPRATRLVAKPDLDDLPTHCSHCGVELADGGWLLVRHRGEHRVGDAFCSVDHMTAWAKAGGRWQ